MQLANSLSEKINKHLQGDRVIWAIAILLCLTSILVVYSATGSLAYRRAGGDTEHYLLKHSIFVILAFGAMYFCHRIDYVYYSRLSRLAMLVSVPMLIIAWLFGTTINEASRWLMIPFINQSFQPSDLAKLALIANVASMMAKRQKGNEIRTQEGISFLIIWCGIICGLIGLTNWSTAMLLFATCLLLFFIGRVPLKYLIMMVVTGMLAGMFAFTFGQRGQTVSSRLKAYLSEETIPFQAEQSYIAVASGGLTGKGTGKSTQKNFLPHPYSDFIFAIIIEEYGFLGGFGVIALYLAILYRGLVLVTHSKRAFGALLTAGLTFSLVMQAFVNMCVVVGLMPITGLPLPLVSMGGTSQLFSGMTIGIILSVSRVENNTNASEADDNYLRRAAKNSQYVKS